MVSSKRERGLLENKHVVGLSFSCSAVFVLFSGHPLYAARWGLLYAGQLSNTKTRAFTFSSSFLLVSSLVVMFGKSENMGKVILAHVITPAL